jgi:ABC-2 type transport system permease protein
MSTIAMESDLQLKVTQRRVVNSEWVKFRSLRSTWWSITTALAAAIGLGVLFTGLRGRDIAQHGGFEPDMTMLSLRGFFLAQLAVGILGVLFVTGEYSTGMIRASLSAVPKRVPVWAAKIAVFAGVIFLVSLVAAFVAFLAGQGVLSQYTAHYAITSGPRGTLIFVGPNAPAHPLGVPLNHSGSVRAIFAAALYLVGVGLLGVGFGFVVRNTGGAIATLVGLLLVLPLLAQALPSSLQDHVTKYLPMIAGSAGMSTVRGTDQLAPWTGLGVFALYVLAALVAGAVVLRRRDA